MPRASFYITLTFVAASLLLGACSGGKDKPNYNAQGDIPLPTIETTTTVDPLDDIYGTNTMSGAAPGTQEDLVASVGDRVFFETDRYDLNQESMRLLESQASWLQAYPNLNITIEGHADERGTREYNLALGERRAQSVRGYLITLNVDPVRINTISYGKERPVSAGSDKQAWALNRRAVTTVE